MAVDQKTALYQAFWRKALTHPTELRFPHKSESDAKYFRLSLYRAVAKHRDNPLLDPELHKAAMECAVGMDKDKTTVLLKRKAPDSHLLLMAATLGIDVNSLEAAPETMEEAEAREMQARLLKTLGAAEVEDDPDKAPLIAPKAIDPNSEAAILDKPRNNPYKRD